MRDICRACAFRTSGMERRERRRTVASSRVRSASLAASSMRAVRACSLAALVSCGAPSHGGSGRSKQDI